MVEDIKEGNLANVEIAKNLDVLIGRSPEIYTNKSFGVPGIKKSINNITSILPFCEKSLDFSIFSILSLDTKLYIKLFPYFLTAKNMMQLLINTPINNIIRPPNIPYDMPASISTGSPWKYWKKYLYYHKAV